MEWKILKNELPPLNKKVLLLEKDGAMAIGHRINCYRFDINDWDYPLDLVYAWTQLPKPCTIKNDENTKEFSPEQFLGCMCDLMIELDDIKLYLDDLDNCSYREFDRVFYKLYKDNIVADFCIDYTFESFYKDMYEDVCKDIFITKRNQFPYVHYETQINEKIYKEKYRDYLMKDLDPKVEEKIKFYLKEYFIDRKELSE